MQFWLGIMSLILSLIIAYQCSRYAKQKGRDPTLWFMAGAFFGLFALLVIVFLPQRRVVKKVAVMTQPSALFQAMSSLQTEKFWYFLDDQKKQYGPMSFSALKTAWEKGAIRKNTFVWNEELENWKLLQDVVQVEPHISST